MKKKNAIIYVVLILTILSIGQIFYGTKSFASSATVAANQTQEDLAKEQEKERKANKYLEGLSIEGYELLPTFNKSTFEYTVIIPNDVTTLEIEAKPEVEGAIVRISGNKNLTKKENKITVSVTAINGTVRSYTILAIKEPEVNLKLSSLQIDGIDLNPQFNENTYFYTSSLEDADLTSLNVTAKANDENAKVEIIGANNIQDGNNLINIILSNDNETTVYQVNLEVDMLGEKEKEADNVITKIRNIMKYATIGIASLVAIIILAIIISIIVHKCRKKDDEEDIEETKRPKKSKKAKHEK